MRTRRSGHFLVTGVLTAAAAAMAHSPPGPEATHASGELGERLVEFVRACESVGFSGVVLAARDGEVVAAVGVGAADLEGAVPNTPTTLFEIASVTKPFTAIAILQLAQQGRLALDDSIALHLPDVPDECKAITIRHLLQHTSGIPGTNSQGAGDDLAAVLPMFLRGGPRHEPGSHWEYWNQGYALLSEIIARASGVSYTEYCRTAIFEPAGMTASCFTGDPPPEGRAVAVGRSSRGAPRSALDHPYGSYGLQYRGMGGIVTSAWDLWRWDRALHGEALLNAESKEEMFKAGLGEYGLGWFVRTDRSGRTMHQHSGGVRGFACEARRYPDRDAALFVLCNRDDVPVRPVADAVEALLFEESSPIAKPPAPLDDSLIKEIVGRYADHRGNVLTVEAEGKVTRAALRWASGPTTRAFLGLDSEKRLVFYEWQGAIQLEVQRDEHGVVTGLAIQGETYRRLEPGVTVEPPRPQRDPSRLKPIDPALGKELEGRWDDGKTYELTLAVEGRFTRGRFEARAGFTMSVTLLQNAQGGIVLVYGGGPMDVTLVRDDQGAVTQFSLSDKAFPDPFRRAAARTADAPRPRPADPAPAAQPPDWAEPLLGKYQGAKGVELVVAMAGRMVSAQVHWSSQGPVTYFRMLRNEAGEFECEEFSQSQSRYPIAIDRDENGKATRITIISGENRQEFNRIAETSDDPKDPGDKEK